MQIFKLLISYYFINYARGSSKTSAETGNDIEKFLLESNSVKELSPKNTEMSALNNKKPDKFMEDLIEVQRTYRSLKEKWQRMMEEKNRVIQMASSTTPPTTTSATSSEVQVIDVDVFEAPEKFQDISSDSEFDDESFMDISVTSSTSPVSTTTTVSQLDQIQTAIREAFGSIGAKELSQKDQKINQPSLFEIIGPSSSTTTTTSTTTKPVTQQQMDATITTIKMDQSPPPRPAVAAGVSTVTLDTVARNQQVPELTMLNVPRPRHRPAGNVVPQDHPGPSTMDGTQIMAGVNSGATAQSAPAMSQVVPAATEAPPVIPTVTQVAQVPLASEDNSKSLLSTFGGRPPAPFPKVATPWRHPAPTMDSLDTANDPFDTTTRVTPPTTTSESPTTSLPLHILPTSSFHSSGSHPDAQPATNLFRYPDQVKIPFFGAKTEEDSGDTTVHPMRPTTPEPFRSEEIQNLEEVEKEDEDMTLAEDLPSDSDSDAENTESELEENSEIEESEFVGDEEIDEITESGITTTPRGIEQNEDYVEETFSQEKSSEAALKVPESFGIGKAPSFEEVAAAPPASPADMTPAPPVDSSPGSDLFGSPPGSQKARAKAFGTLPSSSGPTESEFGGFGSPPGSSGSKLGAFGNSAPSFPTDDIFGSPPGSSEPQGPQGPSGLPSTLEEQIIDSDSAPSFGIGRSPPGFSQPIGPTLPPAAQPQKPGVKFPTLVEQVESFFNEDGSSVEDTGASSALGSFASAEQVANVPVSQNIQVLDDPKPVTRAPIHMPTSRNPVGIFGTKLKTINERAYKPPMFPSALSSETVKMTQLGNPYQQRTTVLPIGPHGLAEPVISVDTELPAWGVEKDRGFMNKARREYQKEFEQQIRDVRIIDEEINKISKLNDNGRAKSSQRCSQVYAHTLSLPQIQKMTHSLGLADVASVIQKASDLTEHQENDIAQLELDLEEKRKLIAKVEILLSLAESRALLFDLLNEQKKIAEKMENYALDLLQKTNFRPHTPSPFSAASDLSELSSAVQQVLNAKSAGSKKGWSMMKRKLHKKSKTPKKFEVIEPEDVEIRNNFIEVNKKAGHLQETAEIVEPVLSVPFIAQNDQFGRQPVAVAVHQRPLPVAPPTMSPKVLGRPSPQRARAAHHLTASKPLAPPGASNDESETVHELIDMLHEDIIKLPAEEEEKICSQVQCDFEKADLCNYESSHDETTRFRFSKSRRTHRQKRSPSLPQLTDDLLAEPSNIADDLLPYTFRAWSIWAGRRADRQKQIDIGPTYSSRNLHFAAVFLEPQQAGILSIPLILSPTSTKIRLRLFEGTRGLRLRICCDRYCPLETEQGLYRGHKSWLRKTVTCPANTQTLSFECLNDGPDRGACGIDDIFVDSNRCHHFFKGTDQN